MPDLSRCAPCEDVRDLAVSTFCDIRSASIQELVYQIGVRVVESFEQIAAVDFYAETRLWDSAQAGDGAAVHRRPPALRRHHPDARAVIIPARFNGPPGSAERRLRLRGLFSEGHSAAASRLRSSTRRRSTRSSTSQGTSSATATWSSRGHGVRPTPTQTCRSRWGSERPQGGIEALPRLRAPRLSDLLHVRAGARGRVGIFAGPVAGRQGVVAATWTPKPDVRAEIVWAALDCPSGWAVDDFQREGVLLGRMAASIHARPSSARPTPSSAGGSAKRGASGSPAPASTRPTATSSPTRARLGS